MTDVEFDRALLGAAFSLAAERGWRRLSVAEAARRAGLPLDRARARFPGRGFILLRFGSLADQAALAEAVSDGPARDRLFGLLMRRVDALQAHREGMLALLRHLCTDPCMAALLLAANVRSMGWMLEGAGLDATGPLGRLRAKGLLAVWLATVRAWRGDTSADLSATMAALDRALGRAEQVEGWLGGRRPAGDAPPPPAEPDAEPPAGPAPEEGDHEPSRPD
jgi:ubiquinone biosynthesis protein COQ9